MLTVGMPNPTPEQNFESLNTFMFKFSKTVDPLDPVKPVKRFPQKAYLRDLNWVAVNERLIAVPKSRQIMLSWWGADYGLWKIIRFKNQFELFKSQDKQHSGLGKLCLLWRAQKIAEQLPPHLFDARREMKVRKRDIVLEFPRTDGYIKAMSMEGTDVHGFTPTLVMDDELGLQQYGEAGLAGVLPSLGTVGQYIAFSTYYGCTFFKRLIDDETN